MQRYLCGVFGMKPEDVRVDVAFRRRRVRLGAASAISGGAGGAGGARARRSVRLVLTRRQMYVLGYRPATIERIELGANADGTLDAITHEAIAVTSQYEDYFPQRDRLVGPAL